MWRVLKFVVDIIYGNSQNSRENNCDRGIHVAARNAWKKLVPHTESRNQKQIFISHSNSQTSKHDKNFRNFVPRIALLLQLRLKLSTSGQNIYYPGDLM